MSKVTTLYDLVRARYGDPDRFIRELRSRMKAEGVSQAKLARRSGYKPSVISRWFTMNESVRVRPSYEAMLILDEALDQIMEGKGV